MLSFFYISFGLSQNGTHAGVVVFSDHLPYTKLEIKFDQYYNLKPFLEHIERLPFYAYRTRIDLAFQIAEKELFSKSGGKVRLTGLNVLSYLN